MVVKIFDTIGEVVTNYVTILITMFQNVVGIFWDGEANTMTLVGILLLIGIGIGIVKWAFNFVTNLVRL